MPQERLLEELEEMVLNLIAQESPHGQTPHGSDWTLRRHGPGHRPPSEDQITQLTALGFERSRAVHALEQCENNVEALPTSSKISCVKRKREKSVVLLFDFFAKFVSSESQFR